MLIINRGCAIIHGGGGVQPGGVERIQDRLDDARTRMFVGRDAEIALLWRLVERRADAHVLGGVGIGKSALLRAIERKARRRNLASRWIDLGTATHVDDSTIEGDVLFLDGFERAPDTTVGRITELVPKCAGALAVITAGRTPRAEAGETIELAALPDDAARLFLNRAGFEDDEARAIAARCDGYPPALAAHALLPRDPSDPTPPLTDHPEIAQRMLAQALADLAREENDEVLRIAALAPRVRRELLEDVEPRKAEESWRWLSLLPFVECEGEELVMNEAVGRALVSDLAWRNPTQLDTLRRQVAQHYVRLVEKEGASPALLSECAWLAAGLDEEAPAREDEETVVASLHQLASTPPLEPKRSGLDRRTFRRDVKWALSRYDRPDLLKDSALYASPALTGSSLETRVERLRELLREACEAVRDSDGDTRGYRVLERTYLRPAVKQFAAAEDLGLSFSTYRRALASALDRVVDRLWQRLMG